MQRIWLCMVLAVATLATTGLAAWSQVVVRTPLFELVVPTRAQVPPPVAPALPAPVPADPGAPPPVPLVPVPQQPIPPVGSAPVVPGPMLAVPTHFEFAAHFKPTAPGHYEVVLLHPCTKCPVKVCFDLPQCPRKVKATKTSLEFRWGVLCCKSVRILFLPNGTVAVR